MAQSALHFNLGTPWTTITSNQVLQPNIAYCVNAGSNITLALPVTFNVNDAFYIYNHSAANIFTVTQNAGQFITGISPAATTVGVTGSLAATAKGDMILLQCIFAANASLEVNVIWQNGIFLYT